MDTIKVSSTGKRRGTVICDKQILFSRENSKLCFCLTEQVPSDKNATCPSFGRGGFLQSRKPIH